MCENSFIRKCHIVQHIRVFPKCNGNSVNSANSGDLNWGQFKDPVTRLFLSGAVVASWLLTQEAGLNPFDDNTFSR